MILQELPQKEWNKTLDHYLGTGTMSSETYSRMSGEQKKIINEIKKAFKRITKE